MYKTMKTYPSLIIADEVPFSYVLSHFKQDIIQNIILFL